MRCVPLLIFVSIVGFLHIGTAFGDEAPRSQDSNNDLTVLRETLRNRGYEESPILKDLG